MSKLPIKRPYLKALVLVVFFIAVYFGLRLLKIDYTKINLEALRGKILSFGVWAPVAYIIFYSLRPLVLFPAGVLSILGGLTFGPAMGTVYTVIGATICAAIEFAIARFFGRAAVSRFIKGRLAELDQGIERHGFKTVLLVRLVPNVAYDVQNYSLGLTAVRFKDYSIATLLGIIPGTFAFVYLGHSLANLKNIYIVMTAVLVIAVIYAVRRLVRRHNTGRSDNG